MATLLDVQLKAATHPEFRQALLRDPRGTLSVEGIDVPVDVELVVAEVSPTRWVLAIPPLLDHELDENTMSRISAAGDYQAMWVQDVVAMPGYHQGA